MGEFCEFEIDFNQFDDLRAVVVHDECDAHEDVWFYRLDGLKAENTKLRDLVESMASRLRWADEITDGGVLDARLKRQLREVGVEV